MKWFKRLTTLEVALLIPLFIGISAYFSTIGIAKLVSLPLIVVILVVVAVDVAKFVSVGLMVTTRGWLVKTVMTPVLVAAVIATSFSFYAALVYSHVESESYKKTENVTEAQLSRRSVERQIERYQRLLEEVEQSIAALNSADTEQSIWQERLRRRELEPLLQRKEEYLARLDSLESLFVASSVTTSQKENLYFLNSVSPNFYFAILTFVFDPLAVLLYALFVRMLNQSVRKENGKEVKEEETEAAEVETIEPEEQNFVSKQEEAEQLLMDKVFRTKRFAFDPTRMQPQKVVVREKRKR